MELRPSAFFYLALNRAGVALILGLMIGSFFAATVPGNEPQLDEPFVNWPVLIFICAVAALSFPTVLLYSWFLAKSYRIELRREGLSLRYGIVGTRDEVMPYRKIQDVVISRGFVERMMSLATLTIQNAIGQPQIIPGLAPEDAEILRDRLLASGN
jgi:membrane protein YdbS with pleckstrin-like domain